MRLVWQLLAVMAVALVGQQGVAAAQGNPWLTLAVGVLTAVVALVVYRWVVRLTERRQVVELGGRGAVLAGVGGVLLGAALFGAVILNIAFLGGYEVHGLGSVPGAVGFFGFTAAAVVTEELLFRGILFRIVEGWTGTWVAFVLTCALFGLSHLANPNASAWGVVAVAVAGGGLLTAAYVATRRLWVPLGLHFGWNFAAGGVFSTEVSGNGTPPGVLDATLSGPAVLTGGDFGPEGSAYAVLFCVLTTVVFLWLARRRGNLVPLRRAARAARAAEADTVATLRR